MAPIKWLTKQDVKLNKASDKTLFSCYSRLIIKVGSALLVDENTGRPRTEWLIKMAEDIHHLKRMRQNLDIVIVSSGAIAVGRHELAMGGGVLTLQEKQAAAAVGQISLAHIWRDILQKYGIKTAQILLTLHDTEERKRHLNARATILELLKLGVVPIINENDTVATQEIRYGDNDRLAARVSTMISGDLLLLLSDVDGLYDKNPRLYSGAKHYPLIDKITADIEKMAGDNISKLSSGGMITKIAAAKIATQGGVDMIIANGVDAAPIDALIKGAKYSMFKASQHPITARKNWIMGALHISGNLQIDKGAHQALKNGKSLLPAGIKTVEGQFERGDKVNILDEDGTIIGVGLVEYSAEDMKKIKGKNSADIKNILKDNHRATAIHRDDLCLID